MNLKHLHHFVALYEEGSVTRAAQRLNVVQSAVSQQLAKFEEELGQTLFERTGKGVVPTHAGEKAYRLYMPILEDLLSAQRELTRTDAGIKGHVSVGVIESVANTALSETLSSYTAQHPDVSIYVTGGYTADLFEMLRTRKLDMVVVNKSARQQSFSFMDIVKEPLAVMCAADNPFQFPDEMTLHELSRFSLVIPSQRHGIRVILEEAAERVGAHLTPRLEIDEINTIIELVQSTDHFTVLPTATAHRAIKQGGLKTKDISPIITRSIVCAYDPNRPMTKAAELFIHTLHENMKNATVQFNR